VTTAGGCGTKPFHHSGMEMPTCRLSIAKVRAVLNHRHIGVGRMVHGLSHWSKGRKPLSPRVGLHYQNARDNKLTAEIGARHPSPVLVLPLGMLPRRDSSSATAITLTRRQ
jgi:hypothetical protein